MGRNEKGSAMSIQENATDYPCCPTCGAKLAKPTASFEVLGEINLSKNRRRAVDCLIEKYPMFVGREAIFNAVYFDDPNDGPLEGTNSLRVMMSRLKKYLKPYGWTIESSMSHGRGREARYRLKELNSNSNGG